MPYKARICASNVSLVELPYNTPARENSDEYWESVRKLKLDVFFFLQIPVSVNKSLLQTSDIALTIQNMLSVLFCSVTEW